MSAVRLAALLVRRGGRRAAQQGGLVVLATAICTALLLLAYSGWQGFADRAERTEWRASFDDVQASLDSVAGEPVVLLDVRAGAPTPPGVAPLQEGEVRVSAAAARLLDGLPAASGRDRFVSDARVPGAFDGGTLGAGALVHPDEAVVAVGRAADDRRFEFGVGYVGSQDGEMYLFLAQIGVVLVAVPLLALGGAAARLGVVRRNERLAAVRLVGGTGGQVLGLAMSEALVGAAAGVVLGVLGYLALLVPVGAVPFQGAGFGAAGLWLGAGQLAGVVAVVLLLTAGSTLLGLRSVLVTPLGVVHRHTPRSLRAVRLVLLVAALLGWSAWGGGLSPAGGAAERTAIAVGLLLVLGVLTLVGPWVLGLWGRVRVRTARGVPQLLAARRLDDDPRGAWRVVGGLALASFVAGTVSVVSAVTLADAPEEREITVVVPAAADGTAQDAAVAAVLAGLDERGVTAEASPPDEVGYRYLALTVPPGTDEDALRGVLAAGLPGAVTETPQDLAAAEARTLEDVGTGGLLVLVFAFVVAATGAGIGAAAAVLDRRRTYALLALAGTPLRVLDRARRAELRGPLLLTSAGSLAVSWVFLLPLGARALLTDPAALGQVAAWVGAGVVVVLLASEASGPLLRTVVRTAHVRPD